MPFVDNLCCFFCNGMITSMLEPHLASTGATTNDVGMTFLVLGAIFMVSTPLAGMVIIVFVDSEMSAFVVLFSFSGM